MQHSSRRQTILIILFLVLVVVFMTMFRMGVVSGVSMSPTYADGQIVLVRRMSTFGRNLRRGDVVLVRNKHDVIIKRVFRLAGEEIDHSFPDVLRPTLFRDLEDFYDQKQDPPGSDGRAQTHYFVPPGYLVIIGDNISNSEDSRVFGPVSIKDVLGVVVRSPNAPYASAKVHAGASAAQSGQRSDVESIFNSRHDGKTEQPADSGSAAGPASAAP